MSTEELSRDLDDVVSVDGINHPLSNDECEYILMLPGNVLMYMFRCTLC